MIRPEEHRYVRSAWRFARTALGLTVALAVYTVAQPGYAQTSWVFDRMPAIVRATSPLTCCGSSGSPLVLGACAPLGVPLDVPHPAAAVDALAVWGSCDDVGTYAFLPTSGSFLVSGDPEPAFDVALEPGTDALYAFEFPALENTIESPCAPLVPLFTPVPPCMLTAVRFTDTQSFFTLTDSSGAPGVEFEGSAPTIELPEPSLGGAVGSACLLSATLGRRSARRRSTRTTSG